LKDDPQLVVRMVRAVTQGWIDYKKDPSPAERRHVVA
jgi:ABC-type nitrate/sulfonate/bicarbonate transport system substrate-binding protein